MGHGEGQEQDPSETPHVYVSRMVHIESCAPEGVNVTLSIPTNADRHCWYADELSDRMLSLKIHVGLVWECTHTRNIERLADLRIDVVRCALEYFYMWVNLAPLSRGTAVCGYTILLAAVLSIDCKFECGLPVDKQLDWEAIFTPVCEDFVNRVVSWFPVVSIRTDPFDAIVVEGVGVALELWVDNVEVEKHCNTYRNMIRTLNLNIPAAVGISSSAVVSASVDVSISSRSKTYNAVGSSSSSSRTGRSRDKAVTGCGDDTLDSGK
mgnify:CR=1 FL=1